MLYGGTEGYMMLYGACGFVAVLLIFVFIVKLRIMKKGKKDD